MSDNGPNGRRNGGFFRDVQIRNFKRFTDLTLPNLGQFNLIVGGNNVGKTSVLEAMLVDDDSVNWLRGLHSSLCWRGIHIHARPSSDGVGLAVPETNYLALLLRDIAMPLNLTALASDGSKTEFELRSRAFSDLLGDPQWKKEIDRLKVLQTAPDTVMVTVRRNSDLWLFPLYSEDAGDLHQVYLPMVPASRMFDSGLLQAYSVTLAKSRAMRERFIQSLQFLLPGVQEVLPLQVAASVHLAVNLSGSDESIPLARFGDGVVKCARILLEIARCKGGRLMIDEVDAGIHHSRLDSYWTVILRAAAERKVQIFATTHSLECLQSLKRVAQADAQAEIRDEARCIALAELPDGNVKAYTYPWPEFQAAIDLGNEIR